MPFLGWKQRLDANSFDQVFFVFCDFVLGLGKPQAQGPHQCLTDGSNSRLYHCVRCCTYLESLNQSDKQWIWSALKPDFVSILLGTPGVSLSPVPIYDPSIYTAISVAYCIRKPYLRYLLRLANHVRSGSVFTREQEPVFWVCVASPSPYRYVINGVFVSWIVTYRTNRILNVLIFYAINMGSLIRYAHNLIAPSTRYTYPLHQLTCNFSVTDSIVLIFVSQQLLNTTDHQDWK